jgi:hypothetical protein
VSRHHHRRPGAAALVAAALVVVPACSDATDRPRASATSTPAVPATSAPPSKEQIDAAASAAVAPFLDALDSRIVAITYVEGHLGVYVKPEPAWDFDRYVTDLPVLAEAARALLTTAPADALDADVCVDAPWLPHPTPTGTGYDRDDEPFATGARILVPRASADRLPTRITTATEVLRLGIRQQLIDVYVDPRVPTETPLYREALRASRESATPTPSE